MISAEVICDSISAEGHRLTTFKLRYPKFIHGEVKTHRIIRAGNEGGYWTLEQEVGLMDDPNLSRNASSSRAIPTAKLIEEVRFEALRASPVWWGKNQPGMQAAEELTSGEMKIAQRTWASAANFAADMAQAMLHVGVHKQIVNRLLEPFSHINVVASATEWDNFFGLRLHKDAQPEMRQLARQMWAARQASTPQLLLPGQWHLPFVKWELVKGEQKFFETTLLEEAKKISVARCARTSYETGRRSEIWEDISLFDRLVGTQPLHASPAEHQASPDSPNMGAMRLVEGGDKMKFKASKEVRSWSNIKEHGNFKGWRQFRKTLPGEACAPPSEPPTVFGRLGGHGTIQP